jgi:quinol monooxygenase YgiN
MSDTLIVIAENDIHAGQLDNLKALLNEMIDTIQREEPKTLNYECFIAGDGASVTFFERYTDSESCLSHLANLGPRYSARLFECLTPTKLTVYGNASDKAREVFSAFPTGFQSPLARFIR